MCNGYLCTYVIKSDSSTFKNISLSCRLRTSKCFCFSSFPVNAKLIKFQAKKLHRKQAVDEDRPHEIGENKGIFLG